VSSFALSILIRAVVAVVVIALVAVCVWGASKLIPEGPLKRALFLKRGKYD
jgi:hypothetical protein